MAKRKKKAPDLKDLARDRRYLTHELVREIEELASEGLSPYKVRQTLLERHGSAPTHATVRRYVLHPESFRDTREGAVFDVLLVRLEELTKRVTALEQELHKLNKERKEKK